MLHLTQLLTSTARNDATTPSTGPALTSAKASTNSNSRLARIGLTESTRKATYRNARFINVNDQHTDRTDVKENQQKLAVATGQTTDFIVAGHHRGRDGICRRGKRTIYVIVVIPHKVASLQSLDLIHAAGAFNAAQLVCKTH